MTSLLEQIEQISETAGAQGELEIKAALLSIATAIKISPEVSNILCKNIVDFMNGFISGAAAEYRNQSKGIH